MTVLFRPLIDIRGLQCLTDYDFGRQCFLTDDIVGRVIEVQGDVFILKSRCYHGNGSADFSAKKLESAVPGFLLESVNNYVIRFFGWKVERRARVEHELLRMFSRGNMAIPPLIHFSPIKKGLVLVTEAFMANLKYYKLADLGVKIEYANFLIEELDKIHSLGYIHGSISPSNLLISRDSKGVLKRAVDGLEGAFRVGEVPLGARIKYLKYMAPENLFLEGGFCRSRAADLFSMGLTLFYILTGHDLWDLDPNIAGAYDIRNRRVLQKKSVKQQMLRFLARCPESLNLPSNRLYRQIALGMGLDSKDYREVREELYLKIKSLSLKGASREKHRTVGELADVIAACLMWDPQERIDIYDSLYQQTDSSDFDLEDVD